MKTLIINGSPRKNGDTQSLLSIFKEHLKGDIGEVSAYYDNIKPCIDCRSCWSKKGCSITDDMVKIYIDDYDIVVIASPIYMSDLPGPLISLASRFQAYYAAKRFLHDEIKIREKEAVLMLVGGGDGKKDNAVSMVNWMFKKMNAKLEDENIVFSLQTDKITTKDNYEAIERVKEIAKRLYKK